MSAGSGARRALVLGGGVAGLATALRLREAGFAVRVWAASRWSETVSRVAAAIWYPYLTFPPEKVEAWGARTFAVFRSLADVPTSGVRLAVGRVLWRDPAFDPLLEQVPGPRLELGPGELPPGYRFGARVTLPIVEMPVFLAWLERRLRAAGGEVEMRAVASLEEVAGAAEVVVNCTGLGARELAGDLTLSPVRGQVVRVENPGLDRFTLDTEAAGTGLTYIVPRTRDVVLGGTAEPDLWDQDADPRVARSILDRCIALEPRLRGARVLEHLVGLRPARPAVRLEEGAPIGPTRIFHNYGHGGAGVTLCWGCAEEVVDLARSPAS